MSSTLAELERVKSSWISRLPDAAKNYISSIPDELQFPIARVAEGGMMYGTSTNGISESMNAANNPARVRGLDMFNACLKLIDLERGPRKKRLRSKMEDCGQASKRKRVYLCGVCRSPGHRSSHYPERNLTGSGNAMDGALDQVDHELA